MLAASNMRENPALHFVHSVIDASHTPHRESAQAKEVRRIIMVRKNIVLLKLINSDIFFL